MFTEGTKAVIVDDERLGVIYMGNRHTSLLETPFNWPGDSSIPSWVPDLSLPFNATLVQNFKEPNSAHKFCADGGTWLDVERSVNQGEGVLKLDCIINDDVVYVSRTGGRPAAGALTRSGAFLLRPLLLLCYSNLRHLEVQQLAEQYFVKNILVGYPRSS